MHLLNIFLLEFLMLYPAGRSVKLAGDINPGSFKDPGIEVTRPFFAFGHVFALKAHPSPEFIRLHPAQKGRIVLVMGAIITIALVVIINLFVRRRESLERLVIERTARLEKSEKQHRTIIQTAMDGF
jgi:hypothetical protein